MPDSALITQQDLEELFTPAYVRRVFCDDGSAVPGPRLARAIQAASHQASAILGKAWPDPEQIAQLVGEDAGAKLAVCQLAMAIGCDARPEWSSDNGGQAAQYRKEARQTLVDMVERRLRSPGERTSGANRNTLPRATVVTTSFEFAPINGRPPRGGF